MFWRNAFNLSISIEITPVYLTERVTNTSISRGVGSSACVKHSSRVPMPIRRPCGCHGLEPGKGIQFFCSIHAPHVPSDRWLSHDKALGEDLDAAIKTKFIATIAPTSGSSAKLMHYLKIGWLLKMFASFFRLRWSKRARKRETRDFWFLRSIVA